MEKTASVKVMRSHDYFHFEVTLSNDGLETIKDVNEMRKRAMMLVDEAVRQYDVARKHEKVRTNSEFKMNELRKEVAEIVENYSPVDRTPYQVAQIKALADAEHEINNKYLYGDDGIDADLPF